jgi:putative peptidoglycan lipid II flippase
MFRRLFVSQFKAISHKKASLLLMMFALLSYVLGFVRDLLVAFYFGASASTDAFFSAYLVPDAIYIITAAGVLSGVFMPMLGKIKQKSQEAYLDYMSAFLFVNTVFTGILAVVAYIFMPEILDLLMAQASAETRELTVELSRILLWSPILFSLANTFSSFLMDNKHYFAYSLGPVLYNVGIIASLFLFAGDLGIKAAVYGVVFGLILMLCVRLLDFKTLNFKLRFRFWDKHIVESLKLAVFKVASILTVQISVMVFSYVAFSLSEGSLSAYNYAKNVQSFAVSLFGISIAQAVFPYFIDLRVKNDLRGLNKMLKKTFLKILFFAWPSAIGLFLVAEDLVQVLFMRGAFDETAVALTVSVLLVLAISIPFEAINQFLVRVYYAFLDTLRPVLIALLFLTSNLLAAFYLAPILGVKAFAIGYIVGSFLQMLGLLYLLKSFQLKRRFFVSLDALKILLAGLLMGVCVFAVGGLQVSVFMSVVLRVLCGVVSFTIFSSYFGVFHVSDLKIPWQSGSKGVKI